MGMEQYQLFVDSLRSNETRKHYITYFQKYQDFMGTNDLFCGNNPRLIEHKIIEFLGILKQRGLEFHAVSNYVFSILAFYKINDIVLNITKIGKFLPEYKKKKDRSYSHQEIHNLLNFVDERYRIIILILASTGIRIGALPDLQLKHLEGNRLTIYENSNAEYITFCTPECRQAIDPYLEMRKRYGENITPESLLIREQFDSRSRINKKQRQLKSYTIARRLIDLSIRCGTRNDEVKICHGFRKFFTTQLINSKVGSEIREMLLGHKIGLASAYYRPTEQDMYEEYEKAIDLLTINEENRLRKKVEVLTIEKSRLDRIEEKMLKMEQVYLK